jgi:MoaA/NifB/PqqE/SkfB family radical SAM enzyme
VGFSGGEPFLDINFLCAVIREAVRLRMSFTRIMTNASCFQAKEDLLHSLKRLFHAGYDGDLCVSVDAFHRQDIKKIALFIETALKVWRRPDMVSIAAVKGAKEAQTYKRLMRLAKSLNARLIYGVHKNSFIKKEGLFIKIFRIDLSPVGKAAALKNAWNGKWFKDDFCEGPGNIFFILPDGTVKPCCGYANDAKILTIGSIKRDTPKKLIQNAENNRFVSAVFGSGLHSIRKILERSGIKFPGKTTNHCFFCHYLATIKK